MAISKEEPPTTYDGRGFVNYAPPPATFSTTSRQILEQGRNLSKEILLADNIVETVAKEISADPKRLKRQLFLKQTEEGVVPQGILLYYDKAETAEQAKKGTDFLVQMMVQQSKLINEARLNSVLEHNKRQLADAQEKLTEAENE